VAMRERFHAESMAYIAALPNCTLNRVGDDPRPLPLQCPHPAGPVGFDDAIFSAMHYRLECLRRDDAAASAVVHRTPRRHPTSPDLVFPQVGHRGVFPYEGIHGVRRVDHQAETTFSAAAAAAEEGKSISSS
jgi:hypothetical protein